MVEQQSRAEWVDVARGLAIALVVLHHASQRAVAAGSAEWWVTLTGTLETVRMPLFFTVAGLFAARWVSRRTPWTTLLRDKVLLLGWVYVVWLGVRFAWFWMMPGGRPMTPYDELVVRLWWPAGGWFVVTLAVMFVLTRALHRLPLPLLLGLASVVSTAFLAGWVEVGNAAWDGLGAYTAFFVLGVVARRPLLALGPSVPLPVALLVPPAWLAGQVALDAAGLLDAPLVGFGLRVAGVAAGVAVALLLRRVRLLQALGRATLPVYLMHQLLVVTAVSWLAAQHDLEQGTVLHLWAPLLVTAVLVPLTYWCGRLAPRAGLGWLFRPPRWLRRLLGDRPPPAPTSGPVPVPMGGGRAGL